jgi:circadian clock protein KaiC
MPDTVKVSQRSKISAVSQNGTHRSAARSQTTPPKKCPTGIAGLDEITGGGLPRGRTSLICGSAGCGKTLLATEFIVRGATEFDEPGVFVAFEETANELAQNVASLGFDLHALERQRKVVLDHVHVQRSEIAETGEYDLEGLFIRLAHAIDSIGAKRIVLDTIETLFSGLDDQGILRSELRRLFRWLKDRGMTSIITAERGEGTLTRQGLEEYVSDCVILLDHRVLDQISTRRLRVVKYRGSLHGTNEYPFLIDEHGIEIVPITSIGLSHEVANERISSGVSELDEMLSGGFYRGSSVLVSGTAGTGKTSLAAHFVNATCKAGQRCAYFAFEESPDQLVRNMRSVGIDLKQWEKKARLKFHATRPSAFGLELHLASMYKVIREFQPDAVVIDPVTNMLSIAGKQEVYGMLMRMIDYLKSEQITAFLTSLMLPDHIEATDVGVSSLMDTWLQLRDIELNGERNRGMYVLKSRGMAHSNQIREFVLTSKGIRLINVYLGREGVLTGSSRLAQEARERSAAELQRSESEKKRRELERRQLLVRRQIEELQLDLAQNEGELADLRQIASDQATREALIDQALCRSRGAQSGEPAPSRTNGRGGRT